MKTGQALIERIGELSCYIASKRRVGASAICAELERQKLRAELAELPDLTFS